MYSMVDFYELHVLVEKGLYHLMCVCVCVCVCAVAMTVVILSHINGKSYTS